MKKTIQELGIYIADGNYSSKYPRSNEFVDQGIPFIRGNNMIDGDISDEDMYYITSEKHAALLKGHVKSGDVLITTRGNIGQVAIVPERHNDSNINAQIVLLRTNPKMLFNRYLLWALQSQNAKEQYFALQTGTALKQLTVGKLEKLKISVTDLENQYAIAGKLDRVYSIIRQRRKELYLLDDLIKARFVEMFGDPISNPKRWEMYQLDDCLERIDNGKSFVCSDEPRTGTNPAVLKLSAVTYGDYRPNENKALLDESQFVERAEVHSGDLLFSRKNTPELVGMAAYVQETPEKLMMPDLIFRLVPNEKMNPVFLWQLINCKEFRPIIQGISGGSAKSMSNISKERLGKIRVICPPRVLQDELNPFVSQVDKSKVIVRKALDEAQLLFDSLIQQYFG